MLNHRLFSCNSIYRSAKKGDEKNKGKEDEQTLALRSVCTHAHTDLALG